jgi:alkylation response protein AidB-like acyl-CoA dehydrogenase
VHFAFTPEQEALRAEARRWLEERYPHERVAELADSEAGWDPASWAELAELGWLGVSVSEDEGGAGLGFLEEAVLFEELGRALYPGPYFSTVALALPGLGPRIAPRSRPARRAGRRRSTGSSPTWRSSTACSRPTGPLRPRERP